MTIMDLSIIIPVYNEQKNLSILYNQLKSVLNQLDLSYEIIFINDGSTDQSQFELNKIAEFDNQINIIEFTRNFGKEMATTAGLNHCQGNAAIILDADLQHPPELIPQFIEKWQTGCPLIVGIRNKTTNISFFKKFTSWLYYKLINLISEIKVVPRATDFRLLDRQVIKEFNRLVEKNRMTRTLIAWLGFETEYIYFDAPDRKNGEAKYTTFKLLRLALSSMIAHSLFPLKFAGYLGIIITLISGTGGFFILIEQYILKDPLNLNFSGPAILAVIILFLIGIVLTCLGLIALYIGNIHNEVIKRPNYVIKKTKISNEL